MFGHLLNFHLRLTYLIFNTLLDFYNFDFVFHYIYNPLDFLLPPKIKASNPKIDASKGLEPTDFFRLILTSPV